MAAQSVDLVCEGGGVKGIGLAGAYSLLEERGYVANDVAGTSAGAITAALIAAGCKAAELKEIVFGLDFRQFLDKGWEDKIPLAGYPLSLLKDEGIYEGERFHEWMRDQLAKKGVRTFEQLKTKETDERWKYRLQVIVSDVTARKLLVLPRDAGVLGIDPDELEVALAVRASMSIPIFFEPVRIVNKQENREHILVDGGMLSNFPVWLFDCDTDTAPDWPTFGLLLVEPDPTSTTVADRFPAPEAAPRGIEGLVDLLSAMVHTMTEFHDRLYVEQQHWARTIGIPTLGVGTTEFAITEDRKQALYDSGRKAADDFLKTWDFNAYVEAYRKSKPPTRRETIVQHMQAVSV